MINSMYVPVIVDETYSEFARVTYFVIENDSIGREWYLGLEDSTIPFFMLGLQGIILGSKNYIENNLFMEPNDFEDTFQEIEKNDNLFVSISSLIIPSSVLKKQYSERGSFLRIPQEVFQLLLTYNDNWNTDVVNGFLLNMKEIQFSEYEGKAFQEWCEKIISMEKLQKGE